MSQGLLTYEQAAAILNVSPRTVRRLVARRKLSAVKLSHNTRRIRPADLERCAEKHTVKSL